MGFKHETKMRAASRFLLGLALALVNLGLLQAESGSEHVSSDKVSPLFVEPSGYDFSENPKLLKRILSSPHGYFRFINIHFGQIVCTRYAEMLSRAPRLNLHGDAHIEQYAVTDLGRGLTDFDDSSSGPGLLDLLRFGVSLRLTLAANGWEKDSDKIIERFLQGYRSALSDTSFEAPEPGLVARTRAGFTSNRPHYLKWVDSLMDPLSSELEKKLEKALKPYIQTMMLEQPGLSSDFFKIEKAGRLKLGIGSALDTKFLLRVRAETKDPNDDVILEVKQVRDLEGISCVIATKNDPFRILLSQARIAYQPFRFLGYLNLDAQTFWVHSWVDNYSEVEIAESFKSVDELAEVAFDAGVQLGLGHPKHIGAPLDLQVRRAQILFLAAFGKEMKKAWKELTRETNQAWAQFGAAVEKGK